MENNNTTVDNNTNTVTGTVTESNQTIDDKIAKDMKALEREALEINEDIEINADVKKKDKNKLLGAIPNNSVEDGLEYKRYITLIKLASDRDLTEEELLDLNNNKTKYSELAEKLKTYKDYGSILKKRNSSIEMMKFNKDNKPVVNTYPYGNGTIGINSIGLKKSNATDNIMAFKAALRGTSIKAVNLLHSGFTIFITPPSLQDMIILEQELHREEITVAKDTATLVNSTKRAYLVDNIATFIHGLIAKHTLALPNNEEIMNYISVLDYDIILAAILSGSSGSSIRLSYKCANNYNYGEDGSPVCDKEYDVEVNLDKMLFIEENYLPQDSIKLLGYKDVNVVSVPEVEEYKRRLNERVKSKDSYTVGNMTFKFKVPSISEFTISSLEYIASIKEKVTRSIVSDNDYKDNVLIRKLLNLSKLADVASAIESMAIMTDDGVYELTKQDLIRQQLDDMGNDELIEEVYQRVLDYLESYTVAKIAYPVSYCSTCRANGKDKPVGTDLHNLTPINMLGFFYQAIGTMS